MLLGSVGVALTCLLVLGGVAADVYLHVPRGSNNRLRERTDTRTKAKRLFDSQNNNRGGYNVGDQTDLPSGRYQEKQYKMKYFQSGPWKTQSDGKGRSYLNVEWTNQHGCGGNENTSPQKQNCALVLQYLCQDEDSAIASPDALRNGYVIKKPVYTKPNKRNIDMNRKSRDVKPYLGLHETWDWYNKCYLRERNKGLFTSDQKLKATKNLGYSSAIHTRQNPNGNRYGYECPEERDYHPYWHPTPWVDVAVLAENASMCSHYQTKSFNVQPYHECIHPNGWSRYNNKEACTSHGGRWLLLHNYLEKAKDRRSKSACERTKTSGLTYHWAVAYDSKDYRPECLVKLHAPDCTEAPWSRSNHLGNGRDGNPLSYKWTLPYFPSAKTKRCVFRIRYNISTDDYDPYHTDYMQSGRYPNTWVPSWLAPPIRQNPYVYIMKQMSPLRLAINTAQFGRVFQDRSHVFQLKPRKDNIPSEPVLHNLNVRGKRGNIVQVYPAVEYDFAPTELRIKLGNLVHIQWTGSNTHRNEGVGGDGQAGSDGEGMPETDRNNLVEMTDRSGNFPTPYEQSTMWDNVEVVWIYHGKKNLDKRDLAINMASSGYYWCAQWQKCQRESVEGKQKMSYLLDNAPASFEGAVLKFTKRGTYHFMCTRNNNFSNRSQKAAIIVE
ncbi:protein dd3-3-like [Plakobranchus ocellatus]|uniref:Protein dd3-3-like n=1 Tax=Plakobranchus ocellatus TaxID=259542 RepID=A0AAV4BV04_9GAST|nr:protein dd3-3-like [Plakobranchus ocellatus]